MNVLAAVFFFFIFPIRAEICVRINTPLSICCSVWLGARLWFSMWLMEVVVLERRLYDVPDYPPSSLHLPEFTPSPPHIPLAALQPSG